MGSLMSDKISVCPLSCRKLGRMGLCWACPNLPSLSFDLCFIWLQIFHFSGILMLPLGVARTLCFVMGFTVRNSSLFSAGRNLKPTRVWDCLEMSTFRGKRENLAGVSSRGTRGQGLEAEETHGCMLHVNISHSNISTHLHI